MMHSPPCWVIWNRGNNARPKLVTNALGLATLRVVVARMGRATRRAYGNAAESRRKDNNELVLRNNT
eukprot:6493949-Lingulodinium_polyedra.AAC.1